MGKVIRGIFPDPPPEDEGTESVPDGDYDYMKEGFEEDDEIE